MSTRAKVAVLRTTPETVLDDYRRLLKLAEADRFLDKGTTTILTQIAADRLALTEDRVRVATPDTLRVPNSGPTVASRTAMVVGRLVTRACDDLVRQLADGDLSGDALSGAIQAWHRDRNNRGRLLGRARYEKPPSIRWDEDKYRGDAYAGYAWSTQVAVVEVDLAGRFTKR